MAKLDIMLSDLPHIEYRKERITEADIEDSEKRTQLLQEKVKRGGLGLSMSNEVDTKDFMDKNLTLT